MQVRVSDADDNKLGRQREGDVRPWWGAAPVTAANTSTLAKIAGAVTASQVALFGYTAVSVWLLSLIVVGIVLARGLGQVWACRARGLPFSWRALVPFIGGTLVARAHALPSAEAALIALAAPVGGAIALLACFAAASVDVALSSSLHAASAVGALVLAVGLLPIPPLDGFLVWSYVVRSLLHREKDSAERASVLLSSLTLVTILATATAQANDQVIPPTIGQAMPTASQPTQAIVPAGVVVASDQAVWMSSGRAQTLARRNPHTGVVAQYALPSANALPVVLCAGRSGSVWYTASQSNLVGLVSPAGIVVTHALPARSWAQACVVDSTGTVWFTLAGRPAIARLQLSGHLARFTLPPAVTPWSITLGPDGALWFAEDDHSWTGIGRITLSGTVTHYGFPVHGGAPRGIARASDGHLYVTLSNDRALIQVAIHRSAPTMRLMSLPGHWSSAPLVAIAPAAQGGVWLLQAHTATLGYVAVRGGVAQFATVPAVAMPRVISSVVATDRAGAVWLAGVNPTGQGARLVRLPAAPASLIPIP